MEKEKSSRKSSLSHVDKLRSLLEIGKSFTAEKDPVKLLRLILHEVTTVMEADRSTIFLVDKQNQQLCSTVAQGVETREIRIPISSGIAGHVATTLKVVSVPDAYKEPRFNPDVDSQTGYKTHSILCAPMINRDGDIIGVIEVLNKKEGLFNAEDSELVLAFAGQAAVAVENALLYEQISRNFENITLTSAALRRSEARLAEAQRIARLGNWFWDIATNELWCSEEVYRIFDISPNEFSGTYDAFLSFVHEEDRDLVAARVEEALREGTPFYIDCRLALVDGSEKIVHLQAELTCDDEGKPVRMAGTVQDITERKGIEEELRKAQKLESLGVLAGGIAHDFNNFLTAILGNISLAIMQSTQDEKISWYLEEMQKATLLAKGLTQQLLTFARGGLPVKEPASVGDLLTESVEFALRGSNVKSEFSGFDDLWTVEVDYGQMSQVINNLAINAQQAMPEGGTVSIKAENVTISGDKDVPLPNGDYVKISVRDDGPGIPETDIQNIFDPYFTTKPEGTGLGLAMCYSIVKKHNGWIQVDSIIGVGTTFIIFLPSTQKNAETHGPSARLSTKGEGKILFMDDDENIRSVVTMILEVLGYEPEVARDGEEVLSAYELAIKAGRPFDAVILDLTIPGGMGGMEVLKRLKKLNPGVKAIASSGYFNDPVLSDFKEHGFCSAICKPFGTHELSSVLHNTLKHY